jgi:motility quorum-sensing regulator / GCU-specific mRNA interferase toxin
MEKRKPHCPLTKVKTLVTAGEVRHTGSALDGALALGMTEVDMHQTVLALTMKDFHKSMTTDSDPKIWQDVYRPTTEAGEIYLKLTVINDVLIVSFKER